MRTALTIAGSDPTGGAGVQADLRVFHHLGVYGLSAISALTAQNTFGVASCSPVSAEFIETQLAVLLKDMRPDAMKTGLLYTSQSIKAVVRIAREFSLSNLVVDPILSFSSGAPFIEEEALELLRNELIPLARVITPNIPEAEILSGVAITDMSSLQHAAAALRDLGPATVVITGGHYDTHCGAPGKTCEVFHDGKDFVFTSGRKRKEDFHGTGCNFSAAVTAYLARGLSPRNALKGARELMVTALSRARRPGGGMKIPYV